MRVFQFLLLSTICFASVPSAACIHGRAGKPGREPTENRFRVLMAHTDGTQTIAIQPSVTVHDKSDFGWVFPVPTLPKKMDVGSSGFNDALSKYLFPQPRMAKKKSKGALPRSGAAKKKRSLVVHDTVQVGPFKITPIEGGYDGVSGWLKKHKYTEIPKSHLKPYLDKNWVILATKIVPDLTRQKKKGVPTIDVLDDGEKEDLELPSIIITFKSKKIVFPWMFERTKTTVPFEFILLSSEPLSRKKLKAFAKKHKADNVKFSFQARNAKEHKTKFTRKSLPKPLQKDFKKLGFSSSQNIHAVKITSDAVSHEQAARDKLADISF